MGRSESLRLMLAHCGQKFEDVSFTPPQWAEMKANPPYAGGGLPHITIGDFRMRDTVPVQKHLASGLGIWPNDKACADYVESVLVGGNDLMAALNPYIFGPPEGKPAVAEEFSKKISDWLDPIEAKMKEKGWKQIAGNMVSPADFIVAAYYFRLCENPNSVADDPINGAMETAYKAHPLVCGAIDALKPGLESYLKGDQRTKSPY